MTGNFYTTAALFVGVCASLPAIAASGNMIKDEDLRSAPAVAASIVTHLARDTPVDVLARQGGWTQVSVKGVSGWVRILSVRTQVAAGSASDLAALATRREGSQVVAVAGLRGLNEEELKAARFDATQLVTLEQYRATPQEAARFARAGHLQARKIPYLSLPKAQTSGASEAESDVLGVFQ